MTNKEKAAIIIKDILTFHLPRVKEGLEKGYVDENQILVIYDHAVRARILGEQEGLYDEVNAKLEGAKNTFIHELTQLVGDHGRAIWSDTQFGHDYKLFVNGVREALRKLKV